MRKTPASPRPRDGSTRSCPAPEPMARIFISYAHEDREAAARLAELIKARGDEVFWDDDIDAGSRWDEALENELRRADRVVVLWSRHSVRSEWVRLEAGEAGGRLLPARLEDVRQPLAFRLRQFVDLLDWEGEADHPGIRRLFAAFDEKPSTTPLWHRSVAAIAPFSRRQMAGTLAQIAVLVLGFGAGAPLDLAPVSDPSLRHLPAALATAVALLMVLLGLGLGRFIAPRGRSWMWRGIAVAAAGVAVWSVPTYAERLAAGTVEVPIGEGTIELRRRVVGTAYTDRASAYLERRPELADSPKELIAAAGGIERVWTPSSIHDRWRSLTRRYLLAATPVMLALMALAQALKRRTYRPPGS